MDFKRTHHVDDINHTRTPAEDCLHESYVLQKTSNIGSLYSSNMYQGQRFEKTVKQLEKNKKVQLAGIDREMKMMEKRMNDLKVRSPCMSRRLKSRSETIGCEKELHCNTKSAFLELPSLALGDRPERMRARLLCRTMSDISLHTSKDHRKSLRPGNFPSTPAINIMTCNNDTEGGTSTDDKINNNEHNIVSQNEESPVVFPTTKNSSFFISNSPVNSPRLNRRSMKMKVDAPPQMSPSPCILAPVDTKKAGFAHPPSPRLRRPYASRSYDDIVSNNDTASVTDINIMRLQGRPRAHTISGHIITPPKYEDLPDREGPKDDQSQTLVLPKI